ncbi:MAG: NAD+ synthase [Candidatus Zixiibacteriota bacterium]
MKSFDPAKTKNTIIKFIRNYINDSGFSKLVVGLSGGLDSATCAYLASKAVGKENVYLFNLPYKISSPESREDAQLVADALGIELDVYDITPAVDALMRKRSSPDKLRLGNVCARMRMIVLYDFASELNALVVATSNKSESYLGYTTLWGDMAGAFAPIGDIFKTQEFEFAEYLGVPEKVIQKPPTADLWEDQTDEDELGLSYEQADNILHNIVDLGHSPENVEAMGFSRENIDRVMNLYIRNKFKSHMPHYPQIKT